MMLQVLKLDAFVALTLLNLATFMVSLGYAIESLNTAPVCINFLWLSKEQGTTIWADIFKPPKMKLCPWCMNPLNGFNILT